MKYKYLLLIVILMIIYGVNIFKGYTNVYLLVLLNVLILLFLIVKKYNFTFILIMIFQWLLYLLVLIIHKYYFTLPGSGNDDLRFEKLSLNYYYHLAFGADVNVFQSSTIYSKILAFFYFLGSPNELIPGILNITVHTIALIFLYKIYLLVLKSNKVALISVLLFTIYPLTLVNTVITLREIYVILFILIFTYSILKYHEQKKWIYIFISIIAILCGSVFHIGLIGLFLFLAIYFLIFSKMQFNFKIIIFITFMMIFFVFITTTENTKIQSILNEDENTTTQNDISSSSRADYMIAKQSGGFLNKIKQEVYFVLKPFPWEIRNLSDVIGFGNVLLILLSFFIGVKLYLKDRDEKILIVLLIVAITYFVFALGTYNYGSALRHRDKSSMLLLMFACQCFIIREKRDVNEYLQNTKKI